MLSIETNVDGETQDFFNEQDRLHMEDVKNLFLGGLKLRTVCLVLAVLLVLFLAATKADMRKQITRGYFLALGVFGVPDRGAAVLFCRGLYRQLYSLS